MRPLENGDSTAWTSMTPSDLWKQIQRNAKESFDFSLSSDSMEHLVERLSLQKVTLLREFCIKTGVQVLLREYNFESRHKPALTEEDILNMFPVVKHINIKAKEASQLFNKAQISIQQGGLKEGAVLLNEALTQFNSVYGAVHPEIAMCLRLLARVKFLSGDIAEALDNQQKAVIMTERTLGYDSTNAIQDYVLLSHYCFASGQLPVSLKLLYRARYLMLLIAGEDHPTMATLDSNIGVILQAVLECDLSLRFLEKALEANKKYYGKKSLDVALSHHLIALAYTSKAEFRAAMQHEKETYTMYKAVLGDFHERTKESSAFLKHVTQQAVNLQRTMNEIYKNGSIGTLPRVQIVPPGIDTLLQQLNLLNGILRISVSNNELNDNSNNTQTKKQNSTDSIDEHIEQLLNSVAAGQPKDGDDKKDGGEQSKDGGNKKDGSKQSKDGDDKKDGGESSEGGDGGGESSKDSGDAKDGGGDESKDGDDKKDGNGDKSNNGDDKKDGSDDQSQGGDDKKKGDDDKSEDGDDKKEGGEEQSKDEDKKKEDNEQSKDGDDKKEADSEQPKDVEEKKDSGEEQSKDEEEKVESSDNQAIGDGEKKEEGAEQSTNAEEKKEEQSEIGEDTKEGNNDQQSIDGEEKKEDEQGTKDGEGKQEGADDQAKDVVEPEQAQEEKKKGEEKTVESEEQAKDDGEKEPEGEKQAQDDGGKDAGGEEQAENDGEKEAGGEVQTTSDEDKQDGGEEQATSNGDKQEGGEEQAKPEADKQEAVQDQPTDEGDQKGGEEPSKEEDNKEGEVEQVKAGQESSEEQTSSDKDNSDVSEEQSKGTDEKDAAVVENADEQAKSDNQDVASEQSKEQEDAPKDDSESPSTGNEGQQDKTEE